MRRPLVARTPVELLPSAAQAVADWLLAEVGAAAVLRTDSRNVRPGDVFLALPGRSDDGRRFIDDAVARGASAVLVEEFGGGTGSAMVPVRAVPGLRELAGAIAANYHGRPSERMQVVAVTGTNGKTSTTHWVARGATAIGRNAAVIGTIGSGAVGAELLAGLTTPDAPALQSLLAGFEREGVDLVAAEASSIGLDQGRLNGTRIDVAAFTNLTRDHLDYHGDLDAYAAAKARLFGWPGLGAAVVNGDDPASARMLAALARDAHGKTARRIVYGFDADRHGVHGDALLRGERLIESGSGMRLTIGGDFGRAEVALPLVGAFNASNALAVLGCWLALGIGFEQAVRALGALEPVPGRMQRIDRPGLPLAVVDYAHSPDAIERALAALRPVARARGGRLWCVFGAGGERDAGKRPLMGTAAERGADLLVITSDNPRGESPTRIAADIRAGLTREPLVVELDREAAIRRALADALPADVVLIAGKGHEAWQEVAGRHLPFSDVEVASAALAARQGAGDVLPA